MIDNAQKESWRIVYPKDCIKYIEAFRLNFWDYVGVANLLANTFNMLGNVYEIAEMGSGAGTNLIELSNRGFKCTGYEVNEESLELSKIRAKQANVEIDFHHFDFMNELQDRKFDAVLSLFVPISKGDMASLMARAHKMIKPGGYFACMLLTEDNEIEKPKNNKINTVEHLILDEEVVVRQNFFTFLERKINFLGVYYVTTPNMSVRSFTDTDTYDPIKEGEMILFDPASFEPISRTRIYGKPDQCPPLTYEVLDIFRKK